MKKCIFTGIFFVLLLFSGCKQRSYFETMQEAESVDAEPLDEDAQFASETVYVQVSGAVQDPGVYPLSQDARVFQAIEAAGGFSEDASSESLNQAEKISDGQHIHILTKAEAVAEAEELDDKVNINKASKSQLMTLPGIGESKAEAIISYREQSGGFSSIEDIKKIPGIKDGVYNKIADSIKVTN